KFDYLKQGGKFSRQDGRFLKNFLKNRFPIKIELIGELRERFKKAKFSLTEARLIIEKIKPHLIIQGEDGLGGSRGTIRIAKLNFVPVLVIPYQYSTIRSSILDIFNTLDYSNQFGLTTDLNRWTARLFPHWVHEYKGEKVLRKKAYEIIVDEALKLAPEAPWTVHGGQADSVVVDNKFLLKHYKREGVKESKLKIIGSINDDILKKNIELKNKLARRLGKLQKFSRNKKVILCAFPPDYTEVYKSDFKNYRKLVSFWIKSLKKWEDKTNVIFQAHPRIKKQDLEMIRSLGAKITTWDITKLIPICDILVTSVSSIIRMAIACEKPVLNYDLYHFKYYDYNQAKGVITVQEKSDFAAELEKLITDQKYYKEIGERQKLSAPDWRMMDGKSGERILSLIRKMIKSRMQAPRAKKGKGIKLLSVVALFKKIIWVLMIIKRALVNRFFSSRTDLFYVIEGSDWIIAWIGREIISRLNKSGLIRGRVITDCIGLKNKIIHFGSENTFMLKHGPKKNHKSNKVVLSWFHVTPGDKRIKDIPKLNRRVSLVHVPCENTRKNLIRWGLDREKIVLIPLGVELELFEPKNEKQKAGIRRELGMTRDKIMIGSFQKDGVGWGEGNEPKIQKGPDIFCEVVERLAKKYPVHVVLTGPARGYVKRRLKKAGIPWTHKYLKNFNEITKYYSVLDLYLMSSREEGGPKSILESMASGVPVVATKTGMAPDIIKDGTNGFLTEIEDVENLVKKSIEIIENKNLRAKIIRNALLTVGRYDWKIIAKRYYEEIYSKL
ncbi:glycosyltransferase, partial [Patescibacteria group bacterium]|nr:glycosyltransferase [Patescibacteria group bacterium]